MIDLHPHEMGLASMAFLCRSGNCNISCLNEDNTDGCLYVYLLLYANEFLFTVSVHAYIYKCGAL